MSQITELASSQINPAGDSIVVELVHPTDYPAMVRITWPNHSTTVTAPNTYPEIAGAITMALARAMTALSQIKARRRL